MKSEFRELCTELVSAWDNTQGLEYEDFGRAAAYLVERARYALTEPEDSGTKCQPKMLTDDELEQDFRFWWRQRYGSPYFGAVPLVSLIEWTRHALDQPDYFADHFEHPGAEEVRELIEWLRKDRPDYGIAAYSDTCTKLNRIVELLEKSC